MGVRMQAPRWRAGEGGPGQAPEGRAGQGGRGEAARLREDDWESLGV